MAALPPLDEDGHQALDLLDGLADLAADYAEHGGLPDLDQAPARAVLERAGATRDQVVAAHGLAERFLSRYVHAVALELLDAIAPLVARIGAAGPGPRREPSQGASTTARSQAARIRRRPELALFAPGPEPSPEEIRRCAELLAADHRAALAALHADPATAFALAPALAVTARNLSLDPQGLLCAMLAAAVRRPPDPAGPLARVGEVAERWLEAAALGPGPPELAGECAPELVTLRRRMARDAGAEARARALAADRPDLIDVARAIVRATPDDERAGRAFAVASRGEMAAPTGPPGPPRRPFGRLHVALALALLALFVWHYLLR
jgi:hypothetical protein